MRMHLLLFVPMTLDQLFSNTAVRRQDRVLPFDAATTLLRSGEYGFLAMTEPDDSAYGLPISYAWDGATSIYIHCAPEGEKLRCLHHNADVCFCVASNTRVIPAKFTTAYESVLMRCTARTGLPEEERMHALRLIVEKYSPEFREIGEKYARGSFGRTEIIRLDIKSMSAKAKHVE